MPEQTDVRVELYVRSLLPRGAHERQERVIERLERLEAANVVASFEVEVWGTRVGPSTAAARTGAGRAARERLETFVEWAQANDRSLRPCFETHAVASAFTETAYTAIEFPLLTLVEYEDDDIRHVAPSTDGTTTYSVSDRLQAFERRMEARPMADAGHDSPDTSGTPGDDSRKVSLWDE